VFHSGVIAVRKVQANRYRHTDGNALNNRIASGGDDDDDDATTDTRTK